MSKTKDSFFGYTLSQQSTVIEGLEKFLKPKEVKTIKENAAYIERIVSLSLTMKRQILSEFDLEYLGVIFKLSTSGLIRGFLDGLSSTMKQEVLFAIQQEYKIGEVMDAQQRFVNWIRGAEKNGSIILCEIANTTMV